MRESSIYNLPWKKVIFFLKPLCQKNNYTQAINFSSFQLMLFIITLIKERNYFRKWTNSWCTLTYSLFLLTLYMMQVWGIQYIALHTQILDYSSNFFPFLSLLPRHSVSFNTPHTSLSLNTPFCFQVIAFVFLST